MSKKLLLIGIAFVCLLTALLFNALRHQPQVQPIKKQEERSKTKSSRRKTCSRKRIPVPAIPSPPPKPQMGILYSDWLGDCSINGTVADESDSPVANAEISLFAVVNFRGYTEGRSPVRLGLAKSNSNGKFSFPNVRHGTWVIAARNETHPTIFSDEINLIDTGDTAEIKIKLPQPESITGTVIDEKNKPVVNAEVSCSVIATYYPYSDLLSRFFNFPFFNFIETDVYVNSLFTTSDTEGRFELSGLNPDTQYNVQAFSDEHQSEAEEATYPGQDIELELVRSYFVSGTVFMLDTRKPVKGAIVRITEMQPEDSPRSISVMTLPDGNFMLRLPWEPGDIRFVATRELSKSKGGQLISEPLVMTLESDYETNPADLFLKESLSVVGRAVVKETGEAAADFMIVPYSLEDKTPILEQQITTDEEGCFRLDGLWRGTWLLTAQTSEYTFDVERLKSHMTPHQWELYNQLPDDYLSTLALVPPGFGDENSNSGYIPAGIVDLSQGVSIDGLVLELELGRSISGTVTDHNGNSVNDALVELSSYQGNTLISKEVKTDSFGKFTIAVLAHTDDDWYLNVNHKDHPEVKEYINFDADEKSKIVDVVFPKSLSINGKVRDIYGDAIEGAKVSLEYSFFEENEDTTTENGSYSFSGLVSDTYTIQAYKEGYSMVIREDVVLSKVDLFDVDLVLPAGKEIRGQILFETGEPLAETAINFDVTCTGVHTELFYETTTDTGAFTLIGLPEGLYTIEVSADERSDDHPRQFFFEKTVHDIPAGTDDLVITIKPTGSISGRVLDMNSREPIVSFSVILVKPEYAKMPQSLGIMIDYSGVETANDRGEFVLNDVYPGKYFVAVGAEGYMPNGTMVNVTSNQELGSIEIALAQGFEIKGKLLEFADKKPIVDARSILWGDGIFEFEKTKYDGRFSFTDLPPGEYKLEIYASEYGKLTETFSLTANIDLGEIFFGGGYTLEGNIINNTGTEIEPKRVNVSKPRISSDIDGWSYKISGIEEGEVNVSIHYHINDECAGTVYRTTTIQPNATNVLDIEIPSGATITGQFRYNGSTVSLATMELLNKRNELFAKGREDEGIYTFEDIPPGKYVVTTNIVITKEDAIEKNLGYRKEITVGSTDLEIPIDIITFELKGSISDGGNKPAAYTRMVAEVYANGSTIERKFTSDGNGNFRVIGTVGGRYTIFAIRNDEKIAVDALSLQPGEVYEDVMLTLP
jgi:Carboxypeptidase regulatory-like domain